MAMKEWVRRMQPFQLYVVLGLTMAFFLVELIISHLTHALTLLMDSYHTLCNIMALGGCILTIKYAKNEPMPNLRRETSIDDTIGEELTSNPLKCQDKKKTKTSIIRSNQEKKLKNTFGWARTDVIFMLICCVFLASLSFSILVESVQTLIHIDHHDEMHHPISVLCLGAAGLLLNGVTYLLIGGYTFHQGSFLYVTKSGDVVLSKVVIDQSLKQGARRLSRSKTINQTVVPQRERQGLWEMTRDINGCILVIICALIVYFIDKDTAKYIDPIMALISCGFIMILSYPYNSLKIELLNHFPDIVNIHDFHIWQLTASKVISTVHIIFQNPKVYKELIEEVKEFFLDSGITQVTIQPEFFKKNVSMESISSKYTPNCLVSCIGEGCKQNHCCPNYEVSNITKTSSKEILTGNQVTAVNSVKITNEELSSSVSSNLQNLESYNKVQKNDEAETANGTIDNIDPPSYIESQKYLSVHSLKSDEIEIKTSTININDNNKSVVAETNMNLNRISEVENKD
ncbi:unnamed protein product [Psylliodes chrysocephalus]|uniref:Cation efflux protein transmembrane domain-containing protein n=1 Tax=Psylliodes chrysocephalus TaxID=3402493 RepID=A0A9P0CPY1_9CUCU|nr:unnamed protein product [Psylliodes chrysocephala]